MPIEGVCACGLCGTWGLPGVPPSASAQGWVVHRESPEVLLRAAGGEWLQVAGVVEQRQGGVIRTNCVDCLDRTNVVQVCTGCGWLCLACC